MLVLSLAVFAFAFAWRLPRCDDHIFLMDSADYVRAARNGFWAQYTGSDTIPVADFIRGWRAGGELRQHPWSVLLDRGDGAALRHFHTPGSFYLYAIANVSGAPPSASKTLTAVISAATIALIFGIAVLMGLSLTLAGLGALVLSLSPALLDAGTGMTPHPLYSLAAMLAIAAFARYEATRRTAWLAGCVVATSVALVTLEFSTLLIATFSCMLGVILWRSRHRSDDLKSLLWAVVGLIVCLFVMWPGGFLRGGYALSYGTLIFQGFLRQRESRDLISTLTRLGTGHLWIGVVYGLLLATGVYGAIRNRRSVLVMTSVIYAALLFAEGLSNGFSNTTYASHFILAIVFLTMIDVPGLFATLKSRDRFVAAASICLLAILAVGHGYLAYRTDRSTWSEEPSRVEAVIRRLQASYKPGTTFVVNMYAEPLTTYAPMFHFFPTLAGNNLTLQPWRDLGAYYLLINTNTLAGRQFNRCVQNLESGFMVSCGTLP